MRVSFMGRLVAVNRVTVPVEIRWRFRLGPGETYLVRAQRIWISNTYPTSIELLFSSDSCTSEMGRSEKKRGWILSTYKTRQNGKTVYKIKKIRR